MSGTNKTKSTKDQGQISLSRQCLYQVNKIFRNLRTSSWNICLDKQKYYNLRPINRVFIFR